MAEQQQLPTIADMETDHGGEAQEQPPPEPQRDERQQAKPAPRRTLERRAPKPKPKPTRKGKEKEKEPESEKEDDPVDEEQLSDKDEEDDEEEKGEGEDSGEGEEEFDEDEARTTVAQFKQSFKAKNRQALKHNWYRMVNKLEEGTLVNGHGNQIRGVKWANIRKDNKAFDDMQEIIVSAILRAYDDEDD